MWPDPRSVYSWRTRKRTASCPTPLSYGQIQECISFTQLSLKAYEALQAEGISVRVIDMFTWKPLDEELVIKAAKETGAIVTAENHNTCCGLGSVVANCLAKNCPTVQEFVGVQDEFGQVGPQNFLMDTYGLRAANIVEAVKKAIARK